MFNMLKFVTLEPWWPQKPLAFKIVQVCSQYHCNIAVEICFSCPDYRFDGINGTPSTPAFDDKHIRLIGCLIRSQSLLLMQLQKITVTCHQVSSWYHKYRLPGYFGKSALTLKLAPNLDSGAFGQGQGARNSSRLMQSACGRLPSVHPSIRQCPGLFPMLWADSPKWSMPSVMEHCFAIARCFATFEVKHRGQKRSINIYICKSSLPAGGWISDTTPKMQVLHQNLKLTELKVQA